MRNDKEKVLNLRSLGKSYNEIREMLKISKSTLSLWLSRYDWSKDLAIRLAKEAQEKSIVRLRYLDKIRGEHLKKVYEEAKQEAFHELETLRYYPLFIAGVMLYWGEGDKSERSGGLKISNCDPGVIRLFQCFLVHVCRVDKRKIKAHLLLYPDLDGRVCREYWKENGGLSEEQFTKDVYILGRHKTRRVRYGVCSLGLGSTYLKAKMRCWIEGLSNLLVADVSKMRV